MRKVCVHACYPICVCTQVYRKKKWHSVSSIELLPGDIISVGEQVECSWAWSALWLLPLGALNPEPHDLSKAVTAYVYSSAVEVCRID